ncbi:uncharacterized protein LOC116252168 [Nymphaea colorata]|nr:uncharacterized protein LOC116252168 [Nymphaea colorata]
MASSCASSKWWWPMIAIAAAALSASASLSFLLWWKRHRELENRVRELQKSLESALGKCAAERRGRIRAQQELRRAVMLHGSNKSEIVSYPLRPIGVVESCFSTRNGTPRQPLLVPLARACLVLETHVPTEALEGLSGYSHCWILYIFHLNTDLERLWETSSSMKLKAKVRVPRLDGGKVGVFATRSPHRPCPIGLTLAKIEDVNGRMVLLSGIDLVDGTPVLDIKPYLPYSDDVPEASIPDWVMDGEASPLAVTRVNFSMAFYDSLTTCWMTMGKESFYASPSEFQRLISQILSWDIRSMSQRSRPHCCVVPTCNNKERDENDHEPMVGQTFRSVGSSHEDVVYHLILEGIDVEYTIDKDAIVLVEKATAYPGSGEKRRKCNYLIWKKVLET